MPEIKTIVFPVDFSARCKGAAHYVEALATKFGAAVKLIHALPPPNAEVMTLEVSGPMLADILADRQAHANEQVGKFLADELQAFRVERIVLHGDPASQIVNYAASQPAAVIVLPTHGYGPFRRFLLGSVAAKVLHDAVGPVLTGVHMDQAPDPEKINVRKVLAAIDLESASENTLRWAGAVAEAYHAKLAICHVSPSIEGRVGELFDPNWREYFVEGVNRRIAELKAQTGVDAEVVHAYGDPAKQIAEVAAAQSADLVVIGRSHEGLHGRLRTHAYAIIRTAPCPVLSV